MNSMQITMTKLSDESHMLADESYVLAIEACLKKLNWLKEEAEKNSVSVYIFQYHGKVQAEYWGKEGLIVPPVAMPIPTMTITGTLT